MNTTAQEIYQSVLKGYPDVLDVKQISAILGVSTKTVYKLIKEGTLSTFKVGREFRAAKVSLMKYIKILGPAFAKA